MSSGCENVKTLFGDGDVVLKKRIRMDQMFQELIR
jgi:hypothetical protein